MADCAGADREMIQPDGAGDERCEPEDVCCELDGERGVRRDDLAEVRWCEDCVGKGEEERECGGED